MKNYHVLESACWQVKPRPIFNQGILIGRRIIENTKEVEAYIFTNFIYLSKEYITSKKSNNKKENQVWDFALFSN